MYQFDMTDNEVKETRWASREVGKHLSGIKLEEGLRIGAVLLKGRYYAAKAAGIDLTINETPSGKAYSEAFREWKKGFRFPDGKPAENYYDAAIVCAQNRTVADEIIAMLEPRQRAEMGIFGLAKRVRAKVKEFDGKPKKVRATPKATTALEQMQGEVADLKERMAAAEPRTTSDLIELLAKREPTEVVEHMRLHQNAWFERLIEAAFATADWEAATPKAPRGRRPKTAEAEEAGSYAPGVLEAIGARIKAGTPKAP